MMDDTVCVMEIKVASGVAPGANTALAQIRARGYAEKYRGVAGRSVFELGLVFSREDRTLVQFDYEKL